MLPLLVPLGEPCLIDAAALFEHLRTSRRLFRTIALSRSAQPVVQASFESYVRQMLFKRNGRVVSELEASIVPHFISSTLQTLVTWWMQDGMRRSSREMQKIFATLAGRGASALWNEGKPE
ncbi:MAG: TetR family transcriptional regulator C-terminal domain-containing protein [Candidatus Eremiobacteraeota bacterium]|nr:TetR family transcriptional regulator C-terminal domain-containing protein [Candidatus Eremiobacteraeota bacterium]